MDNWGWRNTNVALVIISFLERDVASSLFSVIIQVKGILESKKVPWEPDALFWLRFHDDSRIPCSNLTTTCTYYGGKPLKKKNSSPLPSKQPCKTWLNTLWKIQAWMTQKLSYCRGETYFRLIHHEMSEKTLIQAQSSDLISERNFLWGGNK